MELIGKTNIDFIGKKHISFVISGIVASPIVAILEDRAEMSKEI